YGDSPTIRILEKRVQQANRQQQSAVSVDNFLKASVPDGMMVNVNIHPDSGLHLSEEGVVFYTGDDAKKHKPMLELMEAINELKDKVGDKILTPGELAEWARTVMLQQQDMKQYSDEVDKLPTVDASQMMMDIQSGAF